MNILNLSTYSTNIKIVGLMAIVISIAAWSTDLLGIVYVCPYCRVQRSVIGLLGLLLITPAVTHWIGKYVALVIGFLVPQWPPINTLWGGKKYQQVPLSLKIIC